MNRCHGIFTNYAVSPIVNVAEYPLDGFPATEAISELMLSAKIPSRVFVVGFDPRAAYTPLPYTSLLTESGNAICVTFSDCPLRVTSTWICVARPWYQPG